MEELKHRLPNWRFHERSTLLVPQDELGPGGDTVSLGELGHSVSNGTNGRKVEEVFSLKRSEEENSEEEEYDSEGEVREGCTVLSVLYCTVLYCTVSNQSLQQVSATP